MKISFLSLFVLLICIHSIVSLEDYSNQNSTLFTDDPPMPPGPPIPPINPNLTTNATVIAISALLRPGARYPDTKYLKDYLINDNITLGKIQPNGERQLFSLGSFLRTEYFPLLLNDTLPLESYIIYACPLERCTDSAKSFMYGLSGFNQSRFQLIKSKNVTINAEILNPPFQFHSSDNHMPIKESEDFDLPLYGIPQNLITPNITSDNIFMSDYNSTCPFGARESAKAQEDYLSTQLNQISKPLKELQDEMLKKGLFNNSCLNMTNQITFKQWKQIFLELQSFYFYTGRAIVPFKDYLHKIRLLNSIYLTSFYNSDYTKLATTKLATRLIQFFDKKIDAHKGYLRDINKKDKNKDDDIDIDAQYSEPRFLGFLGHDLNMIPYLMNSKYRSEECLITAVLNNWEFKNPERCINSPSFSSNIIIELTAVQNKNEDSSKPSKKIEYKYYVRIAYDGLEINQYCKNPKKINLKVYCIYDEFKEFIFRDMIDYDYEDKCKGIKDRARVYSFWVVLILNFIVLITMITLVVRKYKEMESEKTKDYDEIDGFERRETIDQSFYSEVKTLDVDLRTDESIGF